MSAISPRDLLHTAGQGFRHRRVDLSELPRDVKAIAVAGIAGVVVISACVMLQPWELVPGGVFVSGYLSEKAPRLLPVFAMLGFAAAAGCLAAAAVQPGRRYSAALLRGLSLAAAFFTLFGVTHVRNLIRNRYDAALQQPSAVLPWSTGRIIVVLVFLLAGTLAACMLAVASVRPAAGFRGRAMRVVLAAAPFACIAFATVVAGYETVRYPELFREARGLTMDITGAEYVGLVLAPALIGTLLPLPAYWTVVEAANATREVARNVAARITMLGRGHLLALLAVVLKLVWLLNGALGVPVFEDGGGWESLRLRGAGSWLLAGVAAAGIAGAAVVGRRQVLPERGLRLAVSLLLIGFFAGSFLFLAVQAGVVILGAYDFDVYQGLDEAFAWTFRARRWEWAALPTVLVALAASVPLLRRRATRAAGALCLLVGAWGVPLALVGWAIVTRDASDANVAQFVPLPAQVDALLTPMVGVLLLPIWRGRPAAPPAFLLTVLFASTIAAQTARSLSGSSIALDAFLVVVAVAYLFLLDFAETNTRSPDRPARVLRTIGLTVFAHALVFSVLSYGGDPDYQNEPARYFLYGPLVAVVVAAWFVPTVRPWGPQPLPPPPPPGPEEAARMATRRLPRPAWHRIAGRAAGDPEDMASPRRSGRVVRYVVVGLAVLAAFGALKAFGDGAAAAALPPTQPGPWVRVPVPAGFTPVQYDVAGGEAIVLFNDAGEAVAAMHLPAAEDPCAAAWLAVAGDDLSAYPSEPIAALGGAPGVRFDFDRASGIVASACYALADAGTDRVVFVGGPEPFVEPSPELLQIAVRVRFGTA